MRSKGWQETCSRWHHRPAPGDMLTVIFEGEFITFRVNCDPALIARQLQQ